MEGFAVKREARHGMAAVRLLLQGGGCRSEERGAPGHRGRGGLGGGVQTKGRVARPQSCDGGRKADAAGRRREDSPADHTAHA